MVALMRTYDDPINTLAQLVEAQQRAELVAEKERQNAAIRAGIAAEFAAKRKARHAELVEWVFSDPPVSDKRKVYLLAVALAPSEWYIPYRQLYPDERAELRELAADLVTAERLRRDKANMPNAHFCVSAAGKNALVQ